MLAQPLSFWCLHVVLLLFSHVASVRGSAGLVHGEVSQTNPHRTMKNILLSLLQLPASRRSCQECGNWSQEGCTEILLLKTTHFFILFGCRQPLTVPFANREVATDNTWKVLERYKVCLRKLVVSEVGLNHCFASHKLVSSLFCSSPKSGSKVRQIGQVPCPKIWILCNTEH